MTDFYAEAQSTPAEFRKQVIAGRFSRAGSRRPVLAGRFSPADEIYRRAVTRGEIDPARLTTRVRELAFDLLRNEMMLHLRPVPADVITEIVDDIVLPLITGRRDPTDPSGPSDLAGQA
jgi:hypothetical protein